MIYLSLDEGIAKMIDPRSMFFRLSNKLFCTLILLSMIYLSLDEGTAIWAHHFAGLSFNILS